MIVTPAAHRGRGLCASAAFSPLRTAYNHVYSSGSGNYRESDWTRASSEGVGSGGVGGRGWGGGGVLE